MVRYACLVAIVLLAGCARSVNIAEEQDALMTRDREWSQTTKDVNEFVSYFASDATIYGPGAPAVTGPDNVRKTIEEMVAMPGFALSWTATKAVVSSSGDLGYTAGTYEMTTAGGTEKGKFVTTWKKDDGTWKVVEDIFNADSAQSSGAPNPADAPSAQK